MTFTTMRRYSPLVGVASFALLLAACGGSSTDSAQTTSDGGSAGTALSGQLNGAGASSQAAAQQAWAAGIQADNPDLTVNYDPVGSGGGREQFIAGGVAFAGTDSPLKGDEITGAQDTCGGGYVQVPVYISPIAVAFNLPGIDTLNMDSTTIAKIFAGQITNWNDPAIAASNPDADLPDLAITTVSRSDESGTTENFTEYLAAVAADVWTFEPDKVWPVTGGEAAQGTSGVIQAIQAGEGTIGYADESQVGDLGQVSVKVGDAYVAPSAQSAAEVVTVSKPAADRPEGDLAIDVARDTQEPGVYPIVLVSYLVACQSYDDAQTATNAKGFLSYVVSPAGQQAAAETAGSAPLSEQTSKDAQAAIDLIQTG